MKLRPKSYPEYKDSGLPWLGKIPKHWECHKGKWLFQKMERAVNPFDEIVTCFRDGTVTLRKNRRTLGFTKSLKEIGYQGIRKGDLVIHQMDSFAGAIGVSDSDGKATPVYSVCQPKGNHNTYFYAYIVREMARTGFILSLAKGIRERSTDFRFDTFASQILPVPPKKEQDRIADYLKKQSVKINKFIRAKRRMIELLKEEAYYLVLSGDAQSNVKRNIPFWEDIPGYWKIQKAKWLFSERNTRNTTTKTLLAVTQDRGVIPKDMCEQNYVSPSGDISHLKLVKRNDFVISLRSFQGGIEHSDYEGIVSPAYNVFSLKDEYKTYQLLMYYKYLFKTKAFISLLNTIISGIRDGKNINYTDFSKINVLVPPREDIDKFIPIFIKLEKYKESFELEKKLINKFKARLISDVVTGKVDVQDIPIETVEDIEEIEDLEEIQESEELTELQEDTDVDD